MSDGWEWERPEDEEVEVEAVRFVCSTCEAEDTQPIPAYDEPVNLWCPNGHKNVMTISSTEDGGTF
jgi:hypothetical protein